MEDMNMTEQANIIIGLRELGWSDEKINDFILFVETSNNEHLERAKSK